MFSEPLLEGSVFGLRVNLDVDLKPIANFSSRVNSYLELCVFGLDLGGAMRLPGV